MKVLPPGPARRVARSGGPLRRPGSGGPLRRPGDPRLPAGLGNCLGFGVTFFTAAALSPLRTHLSGSEALGVMAAAVAGCAWCTTWVAAVVTAALGWAMVNGFVVDSYGALRWHGSADLVRVLVLLAVAVAVSLLRELSLRAARRAAGGAPSPAARAQAAAGPPGPLVPGPRASRESFRER